jgi:hypothetical protein
MRIKQLIGPLFIFFIGGLIYVFFRTDSILFFNSFCFLQIEKPLTIIRSFTLPMCHIIPDWVLFSLPDGLWLISFSLIINKVWSPKDNLHFWFWTLLFPLTALVWEFGQAFQLFRGTFDWIDTIIYISITIFIIYKNKTSYHEKTI